MNYYATLGESCKDAATIAALLRDGISCFRLNLSHGSLREKADWIDALHRAERETGLSAGLLIDLRGPEVRTGREVFATMLSLHETIALSALALPETVAAGLLPGQELRVDDGGAVLTLENGGLCRVTRPGRIAPRKSVALPGPALHLPPLTAEDLADLADGTSYGVTAVMQPFVRRRRELEQVRAALHARGLDRLTLFAKVEDRLGWEALPRWMDACDVVTVARGDLGSNLGLLRLPGAQKDMAARCRRAGKPFLVVTQLLHTMTEHPAPTRAEVLDVYNAVLDGASALMLTGETARGRYPLEAVRWLLDIARQAEEDQK